MQQDLFKDVQVLSVTDGSAAASRVSRACGIEPSTDFGAPIEFREQWPSGTAIERPGNLAESLAALEVFGAGISDASKFQDFDHVEPRYLGKNLVSLNNCQIKALGLLSATSCRKFSPQCERCSLASFCFSPPSRNTEPNSIGFIDLFCGAGGLSLGLEAHGFLPKLAIDHDETCLMTYSANRPGLQEGVVLKADLNTISTEAVPKSPLIVGGPPCQGFSTANRQRLSDDPRNRLYKKFLLLTAASGASVCLMENVPGMSKFAPAIFRDMSDIGMESALFELNAADHGYPQYRRRLFWLGLRGIGMVDIQRAFDLFGTALLEPRTDHTFSLIDAIEDLPPLRAKTIRNATHVENAEWGRTISEPLKAYSPYHRLVNAGEYKGPLLNHRTKYNNDRDIELFSRLAPGEGADADSVRDIMPYKSRAHIFKDKYYRLRPDKPSKTITAHMYYDCNMYIHPYQPRGLTPREAARIQGFPDSYRFLGLPNQWYRQIGNAVSPLVSWHVGHALDVLFTNFPTLGKGE